MRCTKCGYEAGKKRTICDSCLIFGEERRKENEKMYKILRIISFINPAISLFFADYHSSFGREKHAEKHITISMISMGIYLILFLIFIVVTL